MQFSDLKPVSNFALRYGVKAIVYGPAGSGKTPVAATSPKPIMLITEPGMLSIRNSNIPAFPAFTVTALNEFFSWIFGSKEIDKFDTICIDSVSQMCEMILTEELKSNKDGRKAYGELSRKVMEKLNGLYYMPNKHLYLICKEQRIEDNNISIRRPFFPGVDLNVKVPHLFDEIIHLGLHNIPSVGTYTAFRCQASVDILARDRTSNLNEFEPPHFGQLVEKCMK